MSSGRIKVVFPSIDAHMAGTAFESAALEVQLSSERRRFIVVESHASGMRTANQQDVSDRVLEAAHVYATEFQAQIFEDYQYELDSDPFDPEMDSEVEEASLEDVVKKIKATQAWDDGYTGQGVVIAVVDTGVDGSRPEFPSHKRKGGWAPRGEDPWADWEGHGSMCACIAAGTKTNGGVFNGVAPNADLVSCRTRFYDSELTLIYDYLAGLSRQGMTILATNSYGVKKGHPPSPPGPGSTFPAALGDAIADGVHVFFSAGNNHKKAGGNADDCHPNSIWLHKSRADLMSVATCDLDDAMWYYSSRGPGQFHGSANTNRKPDVTAPTPKNGRVVYGAGVRVLANGWGTSGACPQVAGLAALLLSKNASLTQAQVFKAISDGADSIGHGYDCRGNGLINCSKSLGLV